MREIERRSTSARGRRWLREQEVRGSTPRPDDVTSGPVSASRLRGFSSPEFGKAVGERASVPDPIFHDLRPMPRGPKLNATREPKPITEDPPPA